MSVAYKFQVPEFGIRVGEFTTAVTIFYSAGEGDDMQNFSSTFYNGTITVVEARVPISSRTCVVAPVPAPAPQEESRPHGRRGARARRTRAHEQRSHRLPREFCARRALRCRLTAVAGSAPRFRSIFLYVLVISLGAMVYTLQNKKEAEEAVRSYHVYVCVRARACRACVRECVRAHHIPSSASPAWFPSA